MNDGQNIPTAKTDRSVPNKIGHFKISIVWLVPLIALAAAGYLIYTRIQLAGPMITITFKDGQGLKADETALRFRGVRIGTVRGIRLSSDNSTVEAEARLDGFAGQVAREGTVFWIIRPALNAGGLRGIDTIVSGSYIEVQPGHGGKQTKFTGNEHAPLSEIAPGTLEVIVTTPHIKTLNEGAPVYFRGMEVGSVHSVSLNEKATGANVHLSIEPRYAKLVRQNSVFWNAGGLNVSLKFIGINITAESTKALVVGGVSFATPDPPGPEVSSNAVFVLEEKAEKKWLEWEPSMPGWSGTNGVSSDALPRSPVPSSVNALMPGK